MKYPKELFDRTLQTFSHSHSNPTQESHAQESHVDDDEHPPFDERCIEKFADCVPSPLSREEYEKHRQQILQNIMNADPEEERQILEECFGPLGTPLTED